MSLVLIAAIFLSFFIVGPSNAVDVKACELPTLVGERGTSLGFPKSNTRLKNKGNTKFTVLFVDFADGGGLTPYYAKGLFLNLEPSIKNYLKNSSYGSVNVKLDPHYTWLKLSGSSGSYLKSSQYFGITDESIRSIFAEAIALADPNVNFSKTDAVLLMINPNLAEFGYSMAYTPANAAQGIVADGKNIVNGSLISNVIKNVRNFESVMIHEILHNYGLVDLYNFGIIGPGDDNFAGKYSPMSHAPTNSDLLGWEKYVIGWIKKNQIECITSGTKKVNLLPISVPQGKKIAVVPVGDTEVLVIEARNRKLNDKPLKKDGVIVYSVDSSIRGGFGPLRVQNNLNPIGLKKTLTYKNVTVTHLSKSEKGHEVAIKVN